MQIRRSRAVLQLLCLGQHLGLMVRTLIEKTVIFHKINRHWEYHKNYESGWDEHGA